MIIGLSLDSYTAIIIFALMSHFILDIIPHWDSPFDRDYFERTGKAIISRKELKMAAIDSFLTVILLLVFFESAKIMALDYSKSRLITGAFMSILPDLLKVGYLTNLKNRDSFMGFLKFHSRIQRDTNRRIGLIIQAVFLIALSLVIFYIMYF